jgi:nitrous oxidase accessory protein
VRRTMALLLVLVLAASSIVAFWPVKAEPKTIVVPDDFPTIQEAIDNASAGDTVYVKKGTYRYTGGGDNAIRIDKPLSLIGEYSQKTVITRGEKYRKYTYNVISITADNVTVSGFTIIGNWGLTGLRIEGIHSQPSGIKIIGNNIASSRWGILTYGGENYIISQNNITGNTDGIAFSSSNSVISGNNITGNDGGINIDSCANVTVSGNKITGNGNGLNLRWDGPFYVYGNNITDNQGFGFQFTEGCGNSFVYQNNIMRNSVGVKLLNFPLGGHAKIGLGNRVYYNNIVDNNQNALVQQNVTAVVSWDNGYVGNYWSDYQSRYPNATEVDASGIGDMPYVIDADNRDRYPFLMALIVAPPKISVLSPVTQLYNETSVSLVFAVNKPVNWIGFSLDGKQNVTVTGNTTLTGLSNGSHNVTVYAKDLVDAEASDTVWFNVAEPFPVVPVAAVSVAVVAVVGAGLLIYFKKRKR